MERTNQGKAWPLLGPLLFAGAFVVYSVGVPLGLAKVEGAFPLAAGLSLDPAGLDHGAPLGLLAIRVTAYLPLGDVGFRGNWASCLLVSLAVAWIGRLCVDLLVLLRPSPEARQGWRDFLYEPFAAVGAAMTAALGLASYESATTVGQSAITLLLIVAGWRCVAPLIRGEEKVVNGLGLTALAGFASSVHPIAGALLWPGLGGLGFWALRRGERWPLLLPFIFLFAFGGGVLANLAASSVPLSGHRLLASLASPTVPGIQHFPTAVLHLGDTVGVIGCLLASLGFFVLLSRQFLFALWLLLTLVTSLLFSTPLPLVGIEPSRLALSLALFVLAPMVACGIFHVASKMGRARAAAALTLSVITFLTPALDGGHERWSPGPMLPVPLLAGGLAKASQRSVVDPGSLAMTGLFRLGRVWGLRPDLLYMQPKTPPLGEQASRRDGQTPVE